MEGGGVGWLESSQVLASREVRALNGVSSDLLSGTDASHGGDIESTDSVHSKERIKVIGLL